MRIWQRLHVKVGGRYPMEEGQIVVDSIDTIRKSDITDALARESGFADRADLLETASHGPGQRVYLIRFHYLPPGAWEAAPAAQVPPPEPTPLLQRIRRSRPPPAEQPRRRKRETRQTRGGTQ